MSAFLIRHDWIRLPLFALLHQTFSCCAQRREQRKEQPAFTLQRLDLRPSAPLFSSQDEHFTRTHVALILPSQDAPPPSSPGALPLTGASSFPCGTPSNVCAQVVWSGERTVRPPDHTLPARAPHELHANLQMRRSVRGTEHQSPPEVTSAP